MKIVALDLEGTLISNAMSQIARPHLKLFLEGLKAHSKKIVIYTTISNDKFLEIANLLIEESSVPEWFNQLEYINWKGKYKDLKNVSNNIDEVLIVDDYEDYIVPEQKCQWVSIKQFEHPYSDNDKELLKILEDIKKAN